MRISEKHGLNPTIPVCFWCGKDKGEIVLLGRLPEDKEAPRSCIVDYEPCDVCKAHMVQGIAFIEVGNSPVAEGFPEIEPGYYPTGRFVVVKPEAVERIIPSPTLAARVLHYRKTLIGIGAFTRLFGNDNKEVR